MATDVSVTILQRVSSDLSAFFDVRDIPEDILDSLIVSLEFVYRELLVLETTSSLSISQCTAVSIVRSCLATLNSTSELQRLSQRAHGLQIQQPAHAFTGHGLVGRPSFAVYPEQLLFLIEIGFSVPQMADMIGVSVRTIRRRMSDFGLAIRAQYSAISDTDLDRIVSEIQTLFPMCGNRQMRGHLLSRGYRIQQSRIRESQRRVDPNGAIIRCLHVVNRREYSVPSPRSLYHIDGHHKLIRCSQHVLYMRLLIVLINDTKPLHKYFSGSHCYT